MSHRKKTSRPDLSSRQAGQCVPAQGGDYIRTSFLSIRRALQVRCMDNHELRVRCAHMLSAVCHEQRHFVESIRRAIRVYVEAMRNRKAM